MVNQEIAKIFKEMVGLLEIRGEKNRYRINSYLRASKNLKNLEKDIAIIYKEKGIKGVRESSDVGEKIAKKIEEYLKKKRIKDYDELKKETAIRQIVTHYFETKNINLEELKRNSKKRKIIYSRFTKPAKQLLDLAGSIEKAKEAMTKVADWAKSRNLDYAIETVFKKWLELDRLKPKEVVKKPYFWGNPIVWSGAKKKWYVIDGVGNWLEFAGKESEIEWRIIK